MKHGHLTTDAAPPVPTTVLLDALATTPAPQPSMLAPLVWTVHTKYGAAVRVKTATALTPADLDRCARQVVKLFDSTDTAHTALDDTFVVHRGHDETCSRCADVCKAFWLHVDQCADLPDHAVLRLATCTAWRLTVLCVVGADVDDASIDQALTLAVGGHQWQVEEAGRSVRDVLTEWQATATRAVIIHPVHGVSS